MMLRPPRSTLFPYATLFRPLLGLSGGVDSSVVAALLQRAIGAQLVCVFVDHGLLRLGEADQVMSTFAQHTSCARSEEHTSNSSHQIISYAVFCLKKKKKIVY